MTSQNYPISLRFVYKRVPIPQCSILLQQTIKQSHKSLLHILPAFFYQFLNQTPTPTGMMKYFSVLLAVMAGSAFVSAAPAQANTLQDRADCDPYQYSGCGVSWLYHFTIPWLRICWTYWQMWWNRLATVTLAKSDPPISKSLHASCFFLSFFLSFSYFPFGIY